MFTFILNQFILYWELKEISKTSIRSETYTISGSHLLFPWFLIWLAHISQSLQRVPVLRDCNFSPNFIKFLVNREERILHCLICSTEEMWNISGPLGMPHFCQSLLENWKMQPQGSVPRKPSVHTPRPTCFSWLDVWWSNVVLHFITLIYGVKHLACWLKSIKHN